MVDALYFIWDMCNYLVNSAGVAITGSNVAMWADSVAIASPWCYERGQVAVILMKWDAMISVPSIADSL